MNTTTTSLESNSQIKRPVEGSTKSELLPAIVSVIPIASFVIKLWFKVLKLSFRAAFWILKKIPTPREQNADSTDQIKTIPIN